MQKIYPPQNKKSLCQIDVVKFIASLLVMSLHVHVFDSLNKYVSDIFSKSICMMAVPFFFIAAGYFISPKLHNKYKVFLYIKRIFILYSLYTICYMPLIIYSWHGDIAYNLPRFILKFIFEGSYTQFWYFTSLIYAVLILYLLLNVAKFSTKTILAISVFCFIIGLMGDTYFGIIENVPILGDIFRTYFKYFHTTRNAVFYGFMYVTIGHIICLNKDKFIKIKSAFPLFLLFSILSIAEAILLLHYNIPNSYNITICAAFASVSLFFNWQKLYSEKRSCIPIFKKLQCNNLWDTFINAVCYKIHCSFANRGNS